jgi:hypothetical protein
MIPGVADCADERADLGLGGSEDRGTGLLGNGINRHDHLPA